MGCFWLRQLHGLSDGGSTEVAQEGQLDSLVEIMKCLLFPSNLPDNITDWPHEARIWHSPPTAQACLHDCSDAVLSHTAGKAYRGI